MSATESLNSASSRAEVKVFSVAHERVSHDHEHEHDHHTTTRKGLALCSHITLDVISPPVGPSKDTHGTRGPVRGKAVGGPTTSSTRRPPTNDRQTTTSLELNVRYQQPGADRHLESYMASGAARRSHGRRVEHVVNKVEEESWIIKKIAQRNDTHHPGEDQPGARTRQSEQKDQAHQDFRRISTRTKLLMCQVADAANRFLRFERRTERVRQGDPTSRFGLNLRYSERAC